MKNNLAYCVLAYSFKIIMRFEGTLYTALTLLQHGQTTVILRGGGEKMKLYLFVTMMTYFKKVIWK
jgi:hypothetical protein